VMPRVAVFDAYGTLLDMDAAMRAHAGRLGPEWQRISQNPIGGSMRFPRHPRWSAPLRVDRIKRQL
jgi:FMN phosphatase YigB (HAD superfamily)